jgi:hypothetical protein
MEGSGAIGQEERKKKKEKERLHGKSLFLWYNRHTIESRTGTLYVNST